MEYYSAIRNEIMKFLGKWMESDAIILSDVTQAQKNTHGLYSLISGYYPPPAKPQNTQETIHRIYEAQQE